MNPTISIIVPVYKVEKYIRRCLDSILAQTFTDWECILVDDGSPDNCGKICDEYAAKDGRFKVFHQENAGVSAARNKGLDEAKGEWIGFVDSDDWVSREYFQINHPKSDIIQKKLSTTKDFKYVNISYNNYLYYFVNKRTNTVWDKLFNRKIIGNIRFDSQTKIGEDFLFLLSLTSKISTYSFSNNGVYFYNRDNNDSAMHNIGSNADRMLIIENNILKIENIIKEPLYFRESIIYKSYLHFFLRNHKILSNSQKKLLYNLLTNLNLRKLSYLSFVNKVKVYYFKVVLQLYTK